MQDETTPTSHVPLLGFEDFNHTTSLASLMVAGMTESDKGPSGYEEEATR